MAAFVYLTATILVPASERVYWFWSGFTADSVVFLSIFYLIPTAAALWALALAPARRFHQVVLAAAIYAFTPIIYVDGPLPVMAAMFVGWHGLVAFVGFWYQTRRWLLARQVRLIAGASALFGFFWGAWALSSASAGAPGPEEIAELGGEARILDPGEFGLYATMVVATLAAAHWLIGFVWPRGWKPARRSMLIVIGSAGLYMMVAVVIAVPWAPVKLAVLIGGTWKLLRRSPYPVGIGGDAPTILDQLAGRVRLLDLTPLALMPAAAVVTYAGLWPLRDDMAVQEAVYWGLVIAQIAVGGALFVWAWRKTRGRPSGETESPPSIPQEVSWS